MTSSTREPRKKRGIYLLPNLFTTGALFAGFYAIVAAMKGNFDLAPQALFIAMVMDMLDGRVARLTQTESAFGAEYDSLSDMVSFGVAPALIAYSYGLMNLGKFGWLVAFIYTAATALRLARFNTQLAKIDKKFFHGLPCPSAAAVVTGLIWVMNEYGAQGGHYDLLVALVTLGIALLQVSSVRYYSFKDLDLKGRVPFAWILIIVLLFVLISIDPPQVLFIGFSVYVLMGIFFTLLTLKKSKSRARTSSEPPEDDTDEPGA